MLIDNRSKVVTLRHKAEELLKKKKSAAALPLSEEAMLKLIQELEVHQIELELQIEELSLLNNKADSLTNGKYAELYKDALQENNSRLELAMQTANMAWWEMDVASGRVTFGKRKAEMLGYSPEKFKHYTDFTTLLHPEDYEKAMNAMRGHLEGSFDKYEVEYRILTHSGEYKWFYDIGSIVKRDLKGKPLNATGIVIDITDRKRSEQVVRDSERRFRAIFDQAPIGMALIDRKGFPVISNFPMSEMVGYTNDELSKMNFTDFTYPEDADKDLTLFNDLLEGRISEYRMEKRYVHKNGNLVWANLFVTMLRDDNGIQQEIIGMAEDISERKLAEETLRNSESRQRTLLQTIPDLIWVKDSDGVYIGCNTMFERFFGAVEAQIVGKTDYDFVEQEVAEFFRANDLKAMAAGKPTCNEEWITFADDGHRAFLETIKAPMYDAQNKVIGVLGIGRDLTERKKADDALLESEIKYRAFFENSMDAIFLTSPDGKTISANQAACEMFGYSEAELIELGRAGVVDAKDPQLSFMLSERTKKQKVRCELTFIRKDGTRFPAEISSSIFKDNEGLERTSMIISDITERKKIQNELKFQADLLNNVGQSVVATDLQGRVIYWNNAAEKIYGWAAVEALGQNIINLIPSRQTKEQAEAIMKELTLGKKWCGEFVVKGKDGNIFPAYVSDTPIFDSEGNLTGIIGISNDITERKFAEQTLQESEERFRHTFDYASSGICLVGRDGKFQQINNAFKEMIGFDEQELKNLTFTDITHPDDFLIGSFHFEKLLNGEIDHISFEKRFIRKDKQIIWAYVSTSLIRDGNQKSQLLITQIIDISERKRAENEIAMLAHSLKSINECVSITDLDNKILFVNESFLKTYGYDINELIGENISIVRSFNNPPMKVTEILKATISGEWQGELLNKRKDGSEFPIFLSTTIIEDKDNKVLGLIGVATNITDRKKAEKELIEAKNKAEESDRLKSAFLANMSHEIRTPMNGILGFAELLKEPMLTGEEQLEYIGNIERSGTRMLNIINDIVNISKVESGQMEVSIKETNINEQIEDLYAFFKPEAIQKGIQLNFKNSLPSKEVNIKSDREKIFAILTKLVKNAIKFTHMGSIEFGYYPISYAETQYLEFYVKDSGVGINAEHQKFIFERFRQGNETLNRNYEGAGLGLTISRAYVEMLGGRIWVESEAGRGSTFYFTIPQNREAS